LTVCEWTISADMAVLGFLPLRLSSLQVNLFIACPFFTIFVGERDLAVVFGLFSSSHCLYGEPVNTSAFSKRLFLVRVALHFGSGDT